METRKKLPFFELELLNEIIILLNKYLANTSKNLNEISKEEKQDIQFIVSRCFEYVGKEIKVESLFKNPLTPLPLIKEADIKEDYKINKPNFGDTLNSIEYLCKNMANDSALKKALSPTMNSIIQKARGLRINISDLPDELKQQIFFFNEKKDLQKNIGHVSKDFKKNAKSEYLWQQKIIAEFGKKFALKKDGEKSFHDVFNRLNNRAFVLYEAALMAEDDPMAAVKMANEFPLGLLSNLRFCSESKEDLIKILKKHGLMSTNIPDALNPNIKTSPIVGPPFLTFLFNIYNKTISPGETQKLRPNCMIFEINMLPDEVNKILTAYAAATKKMKPNDPNDPETKKQFDALEVLSLQLAPHIVAVHPLPVKENQGKKIVFLELQNGKLVDKASAPSEEKSNRKGM